MTAPTELPIEPPNRSSHDDAPVADFGAESLSAAEAPATDASQELADAQPTPVTATDSESPAELAAPDGAMDEGTPKNSLDNLKFAIIGIIILAAAVVAFGRLGSTATTEASSDADAAALAVVASDIVTSAKNDGGAVEAIGGYLPGTGIVLTVDLETTGTATTAAWVADHLAPFAETLAIMPSDESIVVTINDRSQESARVWSLPVAALGSSVRDWNQLVAPATFESNEVAVAADADAALSEPTLDGAEVALAEPSDEAADDAEAATVEPVEEEGVQDDPEPDAVLEPEAEPERDPEPAPEPDAPVAVVAGGPDTGGDSEPFQVVSAFDDVDGFSPLFGAWVLDDGVYSQTDATGFGYAAAFAGVVPDSYDVSVDMRAPNGDLNAGIIYGMPEQNRKHGGMVVDLTAESTYLRWGRYADDTGDWSFIGGAPIEPGLVQDEWQNLKLEVRPEGTSVLLNDQLIVTLDPVDAGDHVALVVSIASVEFKDFFVTGPGGTAIDTSGGTDAGPADYVVFDDELREWTLLSGSWTADGEILSQGNGQAYDQMVHFSNFERDDYRVQVDLRAKPDSIFSGGLLFNINAFGQRPDSQLFDIVDDGQVIRWAGYDQNGVFSYVGGLRTSAGFSPDEWHTIAVEVRNGRASFFVDGEQVGASDNVGDAGYVGLVTSLAAMEFKNFAVTPLS